jgi:molybdate transport system substrate-binding protein
VIVLVGFLALATSGCGNQSAAGGAGDATSAGRSQSEDTTSDHGRTILVFAAASLTDAFSAMAAAFETGHPGVDVELNPAGSATLREQILEGAPADVFASADQATMAAVVDAGQVLERPRIFARNSMTIAVPSGNPGVITGLGDFANDDLLLGICAEGVPCGELARHVLDNADVKSSIDTNESDVRALLSKVEAGELDGGIVYITDVDPLSADVEAVDISTADNAVTDYPVAGLTGGSNPALGQAFVEYVLSAEGQTILADHGFQQP